MILRIFKESFLLNKYKRREQVVIFLNSIIFFPLSLLLHSIKEIQCVWGGGVKSTISNYIDCILTLFNKEKSEDNKGVVRSANRKSDWVIIA